MRKLTTPTALATVLALGACGTITNGPNDALTVAQRHPITVDQQTVTLTVPAQGNPNGLSREALARIDGLVSTYRTRGHGPITVTAPSGSGRDLAGEQTAADVRAALFAFGIPYEDMRGATLRAGDRGDQVVVSFSSYAATGPSCGQHHGELANQRGNRVSSNFGCATQANLAAMIADPRDLTRPAGSDGAGDADLVKSVNTRRQAAGTGGGAGGGGGGAGGGGGGGGGGIGGGQ